MADVWNPLETEKLPTIDEEIPAEEWEFWAEKQEELNNKAVPAGVFTRLGRLTLLTECNKHSPILDLYLLHAEALEKEKLVPKSIPTKCDLYQQEDDRRRRQKKKEEEAEKWQDGRTCYFVIGHSRFWKRFNIVNIIQR
eukprot:15325006-Ditylum_brightwellii.AAC.1